MYSSSLFSHLHEIGAQTMYEYVSKGSELFYEIGKDVLGPLAVEFVDKVLQQCEGDVIFPARDATPFYYIALALKTLLPQRYSSTIELHNPVFNRKLWGIDDEQDTGQVSIVTDDKVQKLLQQIGFGNGNTVSFVEVGCWDTMVDQLRAHFPDQPFNTYFLYTHLPNVIYGFMNQYGEGISDDILETIADTWEAFPKFFIRPTELIEEGGRVKASLRGVLVDSPFLKTWTQAALQGVVDSAKEFTQGKTIIPKEEINRLYALSQEAQGGKFTGLLPAHTETWSQGDEFRVNWRWGKIPPLK